MTLASSSTPCGAGTGAGRPPSCGVSHTQSPWKDAYEQGAYRKQIPDEAMTDYFRSEVPLDKRVLHPNVVVVDRGLLDDLDDNEEEIVALAISALR